MNAIEPGMSDREKLQTLIQAHEVLQDEAKGKLGVLLLGSKQIHASDLIEALKDATRLILDRILVSHT